MKRSPWITAELPWRSDRQGETRKQKQREIIFEASNMCVRRSISWDVTTHRFFYHHCTPVCIPRFLQVFITICSINTHPPPTSTPPPFTMKWQRWQPQIRLDLTTIPITYSRREKQQRCVGVESSNRYGGGYVYIQWSRGEGSRSRKVGRLIIFVEPHKVYGH